MIADKLLKIDIEQDWWTSREVTMHSILTLDSQEHQWLLSLQSYRLLRPEVKGYEQAVLKAIATSWKSQPKRLLTLALTTLNTDNVTVFKVVRASVKRRLGWLFQLVAIAFKTACSYPFTSGRNSL